MSAEGDGLIAKLRVGLAEMGYGEAVLWDGGNGLGDLPNIFVGAGVPWAVWWTAAHLAAGYPLACWACWLEGMRADRRVSDACALGDCQHPEGPHKPPRELLVAR